MKSDYKEDDINSRRAGWGSVSGLNVGDICLI